MSSPSPEHIVLNNCTGDNVFTKKGDIYIDKSVHVSFSEKECEKLRALLGESDNKHVRELEKENKRLSEDNKRLTDMVLKLQRQLIEYLSLKEYLY